MAANALANATLFDRLDRSAERRALVNDASSELSSLLDLDEVLHAAATRLCDIAGVPACDVYRLRDDRLVNLVSIVDGEIDAGWQGRSFAVSEWAAPARAIAERRPVLVPDLEDPLLLPDERASWSDWERRGS